MALTYHNNNSISNVTSFAQVPAGNPVLLSTATASASSSIEFTSGIDSTYDVYQFEFNNIYRGAGGAYFRVNFSTDGGSNYNVTKTTTAFIAYHDEGNTATSLNYETGADLAQSTGYQSLTYDQSTDADSGASGSLTLFNPSSTTYVKHFISRSNSASGGIGFYYSADLHVAGYCNTTSAVNAVRFIMNTGNISSGTIKMYGIKA
jgi:hypothetical protein